MMLHQTAENLGETKNASEKQKSQVQTSGKKI